MLLASKIVSYVYALLSIHFHPLAKFFLSLFQFLAVFLNIRKNFIHSVNEIINGKERTHALIQTDITLPK